MTRWRKSLLGVALSAAAVGATALALQNLPNAAGDETVMAAEIGGPFRLVSSNGGTVDSRDLDGKPYGVFFGFTHCPEVCPTTMYDITNALRKLGDEAKDFRLFFITVDPERDTAARLKEYLANFDPRIEGLVPEPDELAEVALAFRAGYVKDQGSDGDYVMNHTTTVFLMNRQGKLASTISWSDSDEDRLAKLKRLMAP
jgi:protein SCO1